MRIQIIANQKILSLDERLIERTESLLQNIKQECTEFTWTYAEEIDLTADVYLEIITGQKLKIGFMPATIDLSVEHKLSDRCLDDLHWVTIEGQSSEQLDLLSRIILFMFGMICIPSQMGWYMTDLADFKIALQYGSEAKYINFNEFNSRDGSNSKNIVSSIMLVNENLPYNKKLEIVAGIIPQSVVNQDFLNILNMTNSNYLSQTNMILLVFNI